MSHMKITLLYITFIELDDPAKSGSSVRPKQMLKALMKQDLNLYVLDGESNKIFKRRENDRKALKWITHNKVDMCYIEPPSGPMFCFDDIILLKRLHKMNVPISIFYRDCYWMFPQTYEGLIKNRLKLAIIKVMSKRDLRLYQKICKKIYYPSKSMAELIPQHTDWGVLPPGCEQFAMNGNFNRELERIKQNNVLTFFFVGGATAGYGTDLLLETFDNINNDQVKAKLILVCPKAQWDAFSLKDIYKGKKWLQLYHVSEGEELEKLYNVSDICVLPKRKNIYSDFAVNVKLFEYLAHTKPILSTNCVEVGRFIRKYQLGWICKDDPEDMAQMVLQILDDRESIIQKKKNCIEAINNNTWEERAKIVISDLLIK